MDDATLQKVKNTLVVILKERDEARALAVLGVACRWAVEDADDESYRDDGTDYVTANVLLPAEAFGRVPERARSTFEKVVRKTLNEVTKLHGC
jgi:hypothetical protein